MTDEQIQKIIEEKRREYTHAETYEHEDISKEIGALMDLLSIRQGVKKAYLEIESEKRKLFDNLDASIIAKSMAYAKALDIIGKYIPEAKGE